MAFRLSQKILNWKSSPGEAGEPEKMPYPTNLPAKVWQFVSSFVQAFGVNHLEPGMKKHGKLLVNLLSWTAPCFFLHFEPTKMVVNFSIQICLSFAHKGVTN